MVRLAFGHIILKLRLVCDGFIVNFLKAARRKRTTILLPLSNQGLSLEKMVLEMQSSAMDFNAIENSFMV